MGNDATLKAMAFVAKGCKKNNKVIIPKMYLFIILSNIHKKDQELAALTIFSKLEFLKSKRFGPFNQLKINSKVFRIMRAIFHAS